MIRDVEGRDPERAYFCGEEVNKLRNLPSVTFYHVDVTKILQSWKRAWDGAQAGPVAKLRNKIAVCRSLEFAKKVNTCRGAQKSLSCFESAKLDSSQAVVVTTACDESRNRDEEVHHPQWRVMYFLASIKTTSSIELARLLPCNSHDPAFYVPFSSLHEGWGVRGVHPDEAFRAEVRAAP